MEVEGPGVTSTRPFCCSLVVSVVGAIGGTGHLQGNTCSCRTYVPMIACLLIPGFTLRAALRARPGLALRPAALSPRPGEEPLLGPVTAAAEALGVRPGMRMGEALSTCPQLVLVEQDPSAAEQEWEGVLRRLEDAGFSVATAEPRVV